MEFVADYNLDITYHPGKGNLVRSVLRLNASSKESEPLGLEAVNQGDLLTRIRLAQGQDENLNNVAQNDRTEYQTVKDGTILVNGRISVPNDRSLKEEIMREAHKSRFSVHPGATKMY